METITREYILKMLGPVTKAEEEELFARARAVREEVFGNKIFMYGFVYFSTYCRNNCSFCYFRKENPIERYRKTKEEVLEIADELVRSGVHLLDLTMGEDPRYHQDGFADLLDLTAELKQRYHIPVMISPGVVSHKLIRQLADLGADWYALYQETHNRGLFEQLRLDQSYDERMEGKEFARACGMLVEEGILAGVGETKEDIADSLLEMGKPGAEQIRVMSFVPQEGSPMENMASPPMDLEFRIIALMRLLYPHALIPASLDIEGLAGLKDRLNAGGNVVTSIIPPQSGLMGVAQSVMDVDGGQRTVKGACGVMKSMGLRPATLEEYKEYLEVLRQKRR